MDKNEKLITKTKLNRRKNESRKRLYFVREIMPCDEFVKETQNEMEWLYKITKVEVGY